MGEEHLSAPAFALRKVCELSSIVNGNGLEYLCKAVAIFLFEHLHGSHNSFARLFRNQESHVVFRLLFQKGKEPVWFHGKRIDNPNTHGTGCTLSSAIASNLAKGRDLETSVRYAKNYISGALADMLDLGKGSGPMNHAFAIEGEYER